MCDRVHTDLVSLSTSMIKVGGELLLLLIAFLSKITKYNRIQLVAIPGSFDC